MARKLGRSEIQAYLRELGRWTEYRDRRLVLAYRGGTELVSQSGSALEAMFGVEWERELRIQLEEFRTGRGRDLGVEPAAPVETVKKPGKAELGEAKAWEKGRTAARKAGTAMPKPSAKAKPRGPKVPPAAAGAGRDRTPGRWPMVRPSDFAGKPGSTLKKDVEWVYQMLAFEVDDLDPKDAPSPGAWNLLRRTKGDGGNQNYFFKDLVAKLLPSRTTLEMEERRRDDGSPVDDTIAKAIAAGRDPRFPEGSAAVESDAALQAGAEGVRSEPSIPAGDDPARSEQ